MAWSFRRSRRLKAGRSAVTAPTPSTITSRSRTRWTTFARLRRTSSSPGRCSSTRWTVGPAGTAPGGPPSPRQRFDGVPFGLHPPRKPDSHPVPHREGVIRCPDATMPAAVSDPRRDRAECRRRKAGPISPPACQQVWRLGSSPARWNSSTNTAATSASANAVAIQMLSLRNTCEYLIGVAGLYPGSAWICLVGCCEVRCPTPSIGGIRPLRGKTPLAASLSRLTYTHPARVGPVAR
jgi:hypothetical protein